MSHSPDFWYWCIVAEIRYKIIQFLRRPGRSVNKQRIGVYKQLEFSLKTPGKSIYTPQVPIILILAALY